MAHQTFKEFLLRSQERPSPSVESRVRAIRRELQVNKRLSEGEKLNLEMQMINYELLKSR